MKPALIFELMTNCVQVTESWAGLQISNNTTFHIFLNFGCTAKVRLNFTSTVQIFLPRVGRTRASLNLFIHVSLSIHSLE